MRVTSFGATACLLRAARSQPSKLDFGVAGFSRPLAFLHLRSRRGRVLPEALPRAHLLRADPAHIAQKDCLYGVQFASYRVSFSTRGDFSLLRLIYWS